MTNLKEHLATRRSIPIPALRAPAPEGAELEEILRLAVRVPDHGKLAPWRVVAIRGQAAHRLGLEMAELATRKEGGLSDARRAFEEARFSRAPLVLAVISKAAPHFKIPEWEQQLSAGAFTMNLVHALNAFGYAATWITEWVTYDDDAKAALSILPEEKIVGFLYVGTPGEPPVERPRPDVADVLTILED
ncbi:nitroreductase [Aureimonas fodinaquatilis]|uniref:Putative NAD(P)H nitroreductase n=1 Tax=Aureimonas fodinaquatilis TaxID=2565783 RepID=A0A5B0DVW9_9HYPH|nr:nitroreductase [Aureimonas fodinaquatilis]